MKIKREDMAMHLVEYQLKMVGKSLEDAKADQQWFYNITMNQEQFLQFRKYALFQIQKTYKCNKRKAEATFDWFNLQFGLRVVPTPDEKQQIIDNLKNENLWEESISGRGPEEKI